MVGWGFYFVESLVELQVEWFVFHGGEVSRLRFQRHITLLFLRLLSSLNPYCFLLLEPLSFVASLWHPLQYLVKLLDLLAAILLLTALLLTALPLHIILGIKSIHLASALDLPPHLLSPLMVFSQSCQAFSIKHLQQHRFMQPQIFMDKGERFDFVFGWSSPEAFLAMRIQHQFSYFEVVMSEQSIGALIE